MKIKVIVREAEEGGYWAEVPAMPGCATQGETFEELLQNLYEAVEGCLSPDGGRRKGPGNSRMTAISGKDFATEPADDGMRGTRPMAISPQIAPGVRPSRQGGHRHADHARRHDDRCDPPTILSLRPIVNSPITPACDATSIIIDSIGTATTPFTIALQ